MEGKKDTGPVMSEKERHSSNVSSATMNLTELQPVFEPGGILIQKVNMREGKVTQNRIYDELLKEMIIVSL